MAFLNQWEGKNDFKVFHDQSQWRKCAWPAYRTGDLLISSLTCFRLGYCARHNANIYLLIGSYRMFQDLAFRIVVLGEQLWYRYWWWTGLLFHSICKRPATSICNNPCNNYSFIRSQRVDNKPFGFRLYSPSRLFHSLWIIVKGHAGIWAKGTKGKPPDHPQAEKLGMPHMWSRWNMRYFVI